MNDKVAVIGSDVLTLAVAGQMSARGAQVVLVEPFAKTEELPATREIQFSGAAQGKTLLGGVTNDMSAIHNADIIAICITPSQRGEIYPKLAANLRAGQHLLFFTASYGALTFWNGYSSLIPENVTLTEAVSFPCVGEMTKDGMLLVYDMKNHMELAVMPSERGEEMLKLYNGYFDVYRPVPNSLHASLNNINMILHPLPILLSLAAVDNDPANFRHFMDGISPRVGELIEKSDSERLAVGKALGLSLLSVLDSLVSFYGEKPSLNLVEYVTAPDGPYVDVKGFGADCRYVTEDVPFLLVAVEALGKVTGVSTPAITLTIDLANAVHKTDYRKTGYTLDKLGLDNKNVNELISAVENIAKR